MCRIIQQSGAKWPIFVQHFENMQPFIGVYDCKLDDKSRIQLPVALKKQLQSIMDKGFVLRKNTFDKSLDLFPRAVFDRELKKIKKLNRYIPGNELFIDLFMANSKTVELDGTGRVLIPKDLIEHASLDKDIVIASSLDKFKIWDKENYRKHTTMSAEDYAKLAQNAMGNFTYDDDEDDD